MRSGIGFALLALALLGGAVGVWFVVGAGGREPEPIRAAGVQFILIAGVIALAGWFILRSRR